MPCSTHARAHKPCPRSITETVLRAFPFFLSPRLLREATFYVTRLYVRTIDRIVAFTQRLPLFQHLFASCHLPLPCRKNGNNFFSKSRTWRFHAREGEQALDPYLSSHVCRYLTGQDKYLPLDFHDSWYPDSVQFDNCRVSRSRSGRGRGRERMERILRVHCRRRAHSRRHCSSPVFQARPEKCSCLFPLHAPC